MTRASFGASASSGRSLRAAARLVPAALLALAACEPDKPLAPVDRAEAGAPNPAVSAPLAALNDHFAYYTASQAPSDPVVNNVVPPPKVGVGVANQRIDDGHYVMSVENMSDLFHPGNKEVVLTTTGGLTTIQCVSDFAFGLSSSDFMEIRIDCDNMVTGLRHDAEQASLIVGNGSLPAPLAFAFAGQPTVTSYTPDTALSYTSGTGVMRIDRNGVGDWNVRLGTGNPQGSMYLVNSFEEGIVCSIAAWKSFGVRVRCFDRTGALTDAKYKILQVSRGRDGLGFGFASADRPSASGPYQPARSFSSGGIVTVTRVSVGQYHVEFQGVGESFPENVQISTFGLTYAACTNTGQSTSTTGRVIFVQCRDAAGQFANSRFNIVLIR